MEYGPAPEDAVGRARQWISEQGVTFGHWISNVWTDASHHFRVSYYREHWLSIGQAAEIDV